MSQATQGSQALYCAEPGGSPHVFDAQSEPYEFKLFTVRRRDTIIQSQGIRGTRSPHAAQTRLGTYTVAGQIAWAPSPLDLANWLPRVLGAAASGTTFALAETLPAFGLLVHNGVTRHQYTDCRVGKAVLAASAGQAVWLTLDIAGQSEVIGTAYPALTLGMSAADAPYMFHDGVLTLQGAPRDVLDWEIAIDNALEVRFSNSRTATSITPKERRITVKTRHPYTTQESDLYNQALAGVSGTLALANGGFSLTFSFAALQSPSVTPIVSGKGEIVLELEMTARMSGVTRELVVTNLSA